MISTYSSIRTEVKASRGPYASPLHNGAIKTASSVFIFNFIGKTVRAKKQTNFFIGNNNPNKIMPPTGTIRQTVVIPAHVSAVFQAFTDSKIHSEFTSAKATGGHKITATFTAWDGYISGKVLDLIPNKFLMQEWITTSWPQGYPPSILELHFKPIKNAKKRDATEITMIHSKVPLEQVDEYTTGWEEYYWKPLQEYFQKSK